MTNACDDGRALKGLDAREAQAVLRDEFAPAEDMMGTNEMPEGETEETSAGAPRQWSDEERALHLRMTEALLFAAMEPLDEATILESVKKTGRCVIVYEAPKTCGYGAELSAIVAEKCIEYLEGPVVRVAGFDTPFPYALEHLYMPDQKRVLAGIDKTFVW